MLEMEIKSQQQGKTLFKNLPQTPEKYLKPQEFLHIAGGNVHFPSHFKGAQRHVFHERRKAQSYSTRQQRHTDLGTREALTHRPQKHGISKFTEAPFLKGENWKQVNVRPEQVRR